MVRLYSALLKSTSERALAAWGEMDRVPSESGYEKRSLSPALVTPDTGRGGQGQTPPWTEEKSLISFSKKCRGLSPSSLFLLYKSKTGKDKLAQEENAKKIFNCVQYKKKS